MLIIQSIRNIISRDDKYCDFYPLAVYTCKLSDRERPLYLRLVAGPRTEMLSFVLREHETGEVMVGYSSAGFVCLELWNHLGWKGPSRSVSPTVNLTLPLFI